MSAPALTLWSLFLLFFPALAQWGEKRYQPLQWVGPITLCYITGLLIGNIPYLSIPNQFLSRIMEASVVLAIPAMLFTAHPREMLNSGKQALLAFGFATLAATLSAVVTFFLFGKSLSNAAQISGMLASVYTGGTPNMSAVGLALGVENELFLVLNSADMILSGLYFGVLLTIGPALLAKLLPKHIKTDACSDIPKTKWSTENKPSFLHISLILLISALVIGISAGLCWLMFRELLIPVFILLLTTLSLIAAGIPKIRTLRGTFDTAHYLLLIFALSIGSLANFETLLNMAKEVIPYCSVMIGLTIMLHYIFCSLGGIDRDISIIASTAAVFGPPFIGPIAERIKAPHLILNGILLGTLGFAIGNFIGIGLARVLSDL